MGYSIQITGYAIIKSRYGNDVRPYLRFIPREKLENKWLDKEIYEYY